MPDAQERNASMQSLGSADHLRAQDRNISIAMYGQNGGPIFNSAQTVTLEEIRYNHAPEVFEVDSDILTVNMAGIYLFLFAAGAYDYLTTGDATVGAWLEEDPATAVFAQVPATVSYAAILAGGYATLQMQAVLRVGEGYRYRLRVARITGSGNLIIGMASSSLSAILLSAAG
jgi:hypothetical protein